MTKLGQHFLFNKKKIGEIIEALELKEGDTVIEIGPGKGALTIPLFEECQKLNCKIIAIEKDARLASALKEKFTEDKNIDPVRDRISKMSDGRFQRPVSNGVEIIHGDALKILPKLITQLLNYPTANYKIVGNIPYYITGYLLRILGELITNYHLLITVVVLTIQKEVAQRVCAKPLKMNLLAASVQFWAEPKIIGYIPKKDFQPAPKVDSAIIKLTPITLDARSRIKCNKRGEEIKKIKENYYKFIKILFKQPRKTILNNLRPITNDQRLLKEKLREIGINPQARPQDLSIEQIKELLKIQ